MAKGASVCGAICSTSPATPITEYQGLPCHPRLRRLPGASPFSQKPRATLSLTIATDCDWPVSWSSKDGLEAGECPRLENSQHCRPPACSPYTTSNPRCQCSSV